MCWRAALVLIFVAAIAQAQVSGPTPIATPIPFWATKPDLVKRMREDRKVAVAAKAENVEGSKHLTVVTGGVIHAPDDFTHKKIMDFDSYKKHMPYLEESAFDPKTGNVFVHGALFGYHVLMTVHIDDIAVAGGHQIQWKTIAGSFVGMHGTISDAKDDTDHTQVALQADYIGKTLNIPSFILSWGLEFAAQRACGAMRSFIEEQWKTKSR